MVKAGETDAPAATVTVAGTVTDGLLLLSVTTAPPAGAAPFNVTVLAVVDTPPATVAGDSVTADTPGGTTFNVAVTVVPLYVAEIVTGVFDVTEDVVMVNAGETPAPAATVTELGTVAIELLLASVTTAPPLGAGPFSTTVFATVVEPPTVDAGDSVTELTVTLAAPCVVAETDPDRAEVLAAAS